MELDRDSSLLHLKIRALWALGRFARLLGGKGLVPGGGDYVGTGSSGLGGAVSSGTALVNGGRESEAEDIVHLIETSRLRLGDLRGDLQSCLQRLQL